MTPNQESDASDHFKEELEELAQRIGKENFEEAIQDVADTPGNEKMKELLKKLLTTESKVVNNRRTRLKEFIADALEAKSQKIKEVDPGFAEDILTLTTRLRSNLGRTKRINYKKRNQ